jgi:hypothetical protein
MFGGLAWLLETLRQSPVFADLDAKRLCSRPTFIVGAASCLSVKSPNSLDKAALT